MLEAFGSGEEKEVVNYDLGGATRNPLLMLGRIWHIVGKFSVVERLRASGLPH